MVHFAAAPPTVQLRVSARWRHHQLVITAPAHGPEGSWVLELPLENVERTSGSAADAAVLWLSSLELVDGLLLHRRSPRCGAPSCLWRPLPGLGSAGPPHLLRIDSKLDRLCGGLGAKVVHAGLRAELPAVEVHGGELRGCRIHHVDVEGLRLVDVLAALGRHVEHARTSS